MKSVAERLNEIEESVMDELKDFQKATVERIDYLYKKDQNRILVSDEVGLGKTLVARGTIAKFAKLRLNEGDNLVKVVYICSNATIADQNMEKLRLVKEIHVESSENSRLSMQHLNIFKQENNKSILDGFIQLIPLTPNTSFKIQKSEGTMQERALIFSILIQFHQFKDFQNELDLILRYDVSEDNWEKKKKEYSEQVERCNKKSKGDYFDFMGDMIKNLENIPYDEETSLKDSLINLCKSTKVNGFDKSESKKHIVQLRMFFADVSLKKLDPDLIIMDEFQRFKSLLGGKKGTEIKKLTDKFFNSENARILMLSATPYKMYSTLDEIDNENIDEHYSEFFDVIEFLNNNETEEFKTVWDNYSLKLKEINKDKNSFLRIKSDAENELYNHICRTERISENLLSDIVDKETNINYLSISKEDIESYRQAQQLLDDINLNKNVPFDYIKSSPYVMSFMDHYKLKRDIEHYFKDNPDEIWKMDKPTFWLNEESIENYDEIPYNNARLENLMGYVLEDNVEKLLWVPPSRPYYELKGPFKNHHDFSKTLIFSSWEMVPRMVSSMISFEVERKTIGKLDKEIKYSSNEPIRRRMQFEKNSSSQTALFTLIYPSIFLKDAYNPIDCLNRKLSLEEIEDEIKEKIKNKFGEELEKIPYEHNSPEDVRWYYLAPLFLDYSSSDDYTNFWFEEMEKLNEEEYSTKNEGYKTRFRDFSGQNDRHSKKLEFWQKQSALNGKLYRKLGGIPDDLYEVLCDMAIASPAICALRSYEKLSEDSSQKTYFKEITKLSRKFIDMMDRRYTIPVIDLSYESDSKTHHWKNVLKYSKEGNLQAVLDEYVHLLANGIDKNNENKIHIINEKIIKSLDFGATTYEFDSFDNFKSRINGQNPNKKSIRSHFAVSFIKGKGDDKDTDRKKSVRNSFNSPFRPFVLTSTSIGQEGLDFHNYCRRIVHWNLPSNPIDLEQREGRINRFECLAIRQNVAKRYSDIKFKTSNIWDEMFAEAYLNEKTDCVSDLIPYWGLKETDDMIKIERVVPMYPYSKDVTRYKRLMDILTLYRLTLGQANQEYLLESIFKNLNPNEDITELFINLSPYYSIYNESREYELPIESGFCKLTCNNHEKFAEFEINRNLSDFELYGYASRLSAKIDETKLFKKPLVNDDLRNFGLPLGDLMWNLVHIMMFVREGYVGVGIYSPNPQKDKNLFNFLLDMKDAIEKEFGMELYFKMHEDLQWEISIFSPIDIINDGENAINWQICMSKRFEDVFHEKIFEYYKNNPIKSSDDIINRYWIELFKKLYHTDLIGVEIPHSEFCYKIFWKNMNFSEYDVNLHCNPKDNDIGIILDINNRDLYEYLFINKETIEKNFDFKLNWVVNQNRVISNHAFDINNMWSKAIKWQLNIAVKLEETFTPIIKEFFIAHYEIN